MPEPPQNLDNQQAQHHRHCRRQGNPQHMPQKTAGVDRFCMFQGKNKARNPDCRSAYPGELDRNKRIRPLQQNENYAQQHGINRLCQVQGTYTLNIRNDGTSLTHNIFQAGKVGIQKHDMRHLLRCVAACRHSNATVRIF